MKRIIGGLVSLGCLVWIGIFVCGFISAAWHDWQEKDSLGRKQFEAADNQVTVYDGKQIAFGNSDAARQLAQAFSVAFLKDTHDLFKLGSTFNPTTMGNCLTYCRLDDSSVVFLCQVPDMRGFHDKVLDILAKMAWGRAVEVVAEKFPGKTFKMAIGLRGFGSYGAIMEDPSDGNPTATVLDDLDAKSRLYSYFLHD